MTKQELEKTIQEAWTVIAEVGRKVDALTANVNAVSANVNALTGKWGRFVEGMVAPGVVRMFGERGIKVEQIFQRARTEKDGQSIEIDLLAVNEEYALLIEVKSSLSVDDVKEHIERLKVFKRFFPVYQDRKVLGAVAGIVIEEGADRFAYRQGLFVIGQSGETVKILNDWKFKPKVW